MERLAILAAPLYTLANLLRIANIDSYIWIKTSLSCMLATYVVWRSQTPAHSDIWVGCARLGMLGNIRDLLFLQIFHATLGLEN